MKATVELKKDIHQLDFVKGVIDTQFETTYWVSIKQLMIYVCFHVGPLLYCIFGPKDQA